MFKRKTLVISDIKDKKCPKATNTNTRSSSILGPRRFCPERRERTEREEGPGFESWCSFPILQRRARMIAYCIYHLIDRSIDRLTVAQCDSGHITCTHMLQLILDRSIDTHALAHMCGSLQIRLHVIDPSVTLATSPVVLTHTCCSSS
jgi:hypothetical protein